MEAPAELNDLIDDSGTDFGFDDADAEATQVSLPDLGNPVKYCYDGVTIEFPKTAYDSQKMLMEKMIRGIRYGEHCLLESPTGTGKTLALLCPVLAWIEKCKTEGQAYQEIPSIENGPCTCEFDVHPGWHIIMDTTKISWKTPHPHLRRVRNTPTNGSESLDMEELTQSQSQTQTQNEDVTSSTAPQIPTSSSANPTSGVSEESRYIDELCARCRLKYYKRSKPPKIYYVTRTVSQSVANVKQFMSTHYRNRVLMTVLASRDKTCIEESILERKKNPETENFSVDDECALRRKNHYYNRKQGLELETDDGETVIAAAARQPLCKYFHGLKEMVGTVLGWQVENPVWDIEDLRRDAKGLKVCPYFAAHIIQEATAEIVFCTHSYIISKHIRRASKIDLLNSIVIFDEAHNIENVCRSMASKSVSHARFQTVIGKLDHSTYEHSQIRQKTEHDDQYNRLILDFSVCLRRLQNWIVAVGQSIVLSQNQRERQASGKKDFTVEEIRTELSNVHLGREDWTELADKLIELEEMENGGENGEVALAAKIKLERSTLQFINNLVDVFGFLFDSDSTSNDFVICLEKSRSKRQQAELEASFRRSAGGMQAVGPKKPRLEEDERQFDYQLKIICLNPALAFEDIKKVTRTIIITSGTLSPMNALQAELNTNFAHQISALHVVPTSNVWVGIVHKSSSPKKPSLKIVKDTQKSVDTQDELGSIILKICKTVPFGVLVLVPSYGFLNDLRSRWSQRLNDSDSELPVVLPVLEQLGLQKHIFYESQNAQDFQRDIKNYKKLSVMEKGAIFFGIFRGKVSEGVDFADDQARAVVSIGIPLLPIGAPEVSHKMKYNDEKWVMYNNPFTRVPNSLRPLPGREWYDAQGCRALNQGLGRAIRHINDWGAIFIIEKRFELPHAPARSRLPEWVNRSATSFSSVEDSIRSLQEFVRVKLQER